MTGQAEHSAHESLWAERTGLSTLVSFHYRLMKSSRPVKWGILFGLAEHPWPQTFNDAICKTLSNTVNPIRTVIFVTFLFELGRRQAKILEPTLVNFWTMKRGLQRNHSSKKKLGTCLITEWESQVLRGVCFFALQWKSQQPNEGHHCVSGKYGAQWVCASITVCPSVSAHIHLSIHICHSRPFSLSLSNSAYCAFYEMYLCLLLPLTAVWLTPLPLPFPLSSLHLSALTDLNTSVLLNRRPGVPYEVTLPGSVSSPRMSQLAWNHMNGFEIASK